MDVKAMQLKELKKGPVLSIIVPIYNVEKYLTECLDSILDSIYEDLEIILIDDGSPDNCGTICDEYADRDSRIKVIHQRNLGLSAARNTGLEVAQGEFISFVDSDDLISEDLYSENIPILLNNRNIDILEFPALALQNSGKKTLLLRKDEVLLQGGKSMLLNDMEFDGKLNCYVWFKIYKRSLFSDIKFLPGRFYEDMFIYPQLLSKINLIYVSAKGYYIYRQRSESIVHIKQDINKRRDRLEAEIAILQWMIAHGEKEKYFYSLYSQVITNLDSMSYLFPALSFSNYSRQLDRYRVTWKVLLGLNLPIKDKVKLLGAKCLRLERWTYCYCVFKKFHKG